MVGVFVGVKVRVCVFVAPGTGERVWVGVKVRVGVEVRVGVGVNVGVGPPPPEHAGRVPHAMP